MMKGPSSCPRRSQEQRRRSPLEFHHLHHRTSTLLGCMRALQALGCQVLTTPRYHRFCTSAAISLRLAMDASSLPQMAHTAASKIRGAFSKASPSAVSERAGPTSPPSAGEAVAGYAKQEADYPTTFVGVSDAQGHRDYMEDRHTIIPNFDVGAVDGLPRQFVAVYDGHSSHKGSEHASRRLHEFVAGQEAVRRCQGEPRSLEESEAMEEALKGAFSDADDEIVEAAVRGGKRYGTTAVCAMRVGRVVYVAHAGDSRAVLCRDGRAVSLTKDHKPTVPEEAARIEAQGGVIDRSTDYVITDTYMLNMSRALGDPDFKHPRQLVENEPDVARVVLKPGRDYFIVLGSDGVFDVMSNQDAVDAVQQLVAQAGGRMSGQVAEAAAQALVQHALKLKTRDNVTAIVMLVQWE